MSRVAPVPVAAALVTATLLAGCGHADPQIGQDRASAQDPTHSSPTHPAPTHSSPTPPATTAAAVPTRVRASTESWRLPVPSARQAAISDGTAVILAGGMLGDDTSTAVVRRILLPGGQTTALPSLAVPVHDAAGGRYAGAPAVFGGGNATEQSLVQALRGPAWARVDRFPTTRSDLSVLTLPQGTVGLGGYDGTREPRAVFVQQGSTRMQARGRLARGVRYAATAALGDTVFILGGEVAGSELDQVQAYDVRTGRSRVVATLPRPLGHAMAVAVGGRILLMGGRTAPHVLTSAMWWFDPTTGRFTRAGRLPRPLSDAAVAAAGGTAYLLGGEQPAVTDQVVRVDTGG